MVSICLSCMFKEFLLVNCLAFYNFTAAVAVDLLENTKVNKVPKKSVKKELNQKLRSL